MSLGTVDTGFDPRAMLLANIGISEDEIRVLANYEMNVFYRHESLDSWPTYICHVRRPDGKTIFQSEGIPFSEIIPTMEKALMKELLNIAAEEMLSE